MQPDEVAAIAEEMAERFRIVEAELLASLAEVLTNPYRARDPHGTLRIIEVKLRALSTTQMEGWLSRRFPLAYAMGGQSMADALSVAFSPHTPAHRLVVQATRARIAATFGGTLQDVTMSTKGRLRRLGDDAARQQLLEGIPGPRAGEAFVKAIQRETGLLTVRYSNGARHSISDWADAALRTETAHAYNFGSFAVARDEGIGWLEAVDGADCCLGPGHNVGPLANGRVFSLEEAVAHPLSHVRCSRSWAPRPGITSAEEAEAGRRFDDATQQRMADEERARAARQNVDGRPRGTLGAGRQPRTARQARQPREPRAPR